MRVGVGDDSEWQAALLAAGLRSHILIWADFESGGLGIWSGSHSLTVTDSDTLLNGKTFEPISEGILIDIGQNAFSYSGSEALPITLAIPDVPTDAMIYSAASPDEWQGRLAVVWRAMMVTPPTESSAAVWAFKRTRAGSMDDLSISNTGSEHIFKLSIEGHASMISQATQSTWLDQKKFDPTDTSQDWAVSSANSPSSPGRGSNGGFGGGGGGFGGGGGGGGGRSFNQLV